MNHREAEDDTLCLPLTRISHSGRHALGPATIITVRSRFAAGNGAKCR